MTNPQTFPSKSLAIRAGKKTGQPFDPICNADGSWSLSPQLATITMEGGGVSEAMDIDRALVEAADIASDGIATTVTTHPEKKMVKTFGKPAKKTPAAKKPAKAAAPKTVAKPAKAAKPVTKAAPAKPEKAPPSGGKFDIVRKLAQRPKGVTSAELKAATGWENAGWNTIMKAAAKSAGLKLTLGKAQAENSKREVTVFSMT